MSPQKNRRNRGRDERRRAEWSGRIAELVAAVFLMAKGYTIVARRVRSRYGEIDLVAKRGKRLAFVEVKYRRDLETARRSISQEQTERLANAAEKWAWAHPAYRNFRFGLDAVYIVPWRWPRHDMDGLQSF